MDRFVADQRHREREALPSLAVRRPGGDASTVTTTTRSTVFNAARKLLRDALERGAAERLGLDREFIIAIPTAGATVGRTARRPFPDEVARALADEANLADLAGTYDVNDGGVRDIWETTVITGRRIGEVIKLRWDCIGRYGRLAMFWHDQTKVGNYDAAIRIPERLYDLLAERQLLAGESAPLSREQAVALAIDLSRRSTPAEGGFCTFQPVVDGGACPWNLNCHSCDKFVLSGADLLYWRRKREQWQLLAEGAPDDATADYLHAYFEPTARAIDGLEKALAGLGLLDDALALDLRKPQDYFHRVWSTAFRAADLAGAVEAEDDTGHPGDDPGLGDR